MSDIIRRMKKHAAKPASAEAEKESVAMERITVRLPKAVRDQLRVLADVADRDYTEYARRVLVAHVRETKKA